MAQSKNRPDGVRHAGLWEAIQIGLLAAAVIRWGSVPDRLPVHWNAAGEVDGYGGRFEGLALVPLIGVALYLLLRYLPRIDPARRNYDAFAGAYLLLRVTILVYLVFIDVVIQLAIGREESVPVGRLIVGSVGALFVVLGGVMTRLKPNWFAGIRTPWTLSSAESWRVTHRVGGVLFAVVGALTLVSAPFSGPVPIVVLLVGMVLTLVVVTVVSYRVWRDDPDKVPLTDLRSRRD